MLLRGGMPLASPGVASEDLRVVPAATGMDDREVAGVEFMDAPLADLDRVIADGDSIWCAQCRASDERVVLKSSCHVGQGVTRVPSLLKICEEIYGEPERISTVSVRRQAVHHDLPCARDAAPARL